MSRLSPCKRRDFIKKLRNLEFTGPYSGTRHQFMVYHHHRLTIPSNDDYSVPQLKMMLSEIKTILARDVSLEEWDRL